MQRKMLLAIRNTLAAKQRQSRLDVKIRNGDPWNGKKYFLSKPMTFGKPEMPVVHRRIIAVTFRSKGMPKQQDPVAASPERYCICRSSRADGFMICCDKCNEWFHGECIGLDEDVGLQYDVYFCDKCRLKNPRLKCTYKTQPTVPIVRPVVAKRAPEPELDSTRAVPPVASKPTSLVTRRKSFSALVAVNEMLGEDRKREPQKPPRTRSADEAAPVKSLESKASQCNLGTNSEERTSANKGPSANIRGLKRRICCTCSCDETARPDSRYCSDECGSVTTLTRIFAVMPRLLPTWGLNCDEAKADDMMQALTKTQPKLVLETESEIGTVSEKSSKPAALEKQIGNGPAIKDAGKVPETPSIKSKNQNPPKRANVPETPTKCNRENQASNSHNIKQNSFEKDRHSRSSSRTLSIIEKSGKDKAPSTQHTPRKVSSLTKTQIMDKYFKTPCSSSKNLKAVNTPRRESENIIESKTRAEPKTLGTPDTKALSKIVNQTNIKSQYDTQNKRIYIERSNVCFDKGLIKEPILCRPNESSCQKLKALSQIVSKLLPEQKDYLARRRKALEDQRRVSSKMPIKVQRAPKASKLKD
ncbi:uncharacterized protein Dana_GF22474, isoform B [Drosophila ananassae]|uniref:Uncharacterized protein, isoform B n=2 Tax=Drosophila ananassae TaxID=7217 RepID=A0A0P8XHA3_DROAN|nr:uncharacterized protein Dana_GF22474, isoform B [Drosophila ananassae]